MLSFISKIIGTLLLGAALLAQTGCACGTGGGPCTAEQPTPPRSMCDTEPGEMAAALPPNAKPGECYAKVWVPPTFKTVTERVLVRDASVTLETIPAKYEWVEEKVLVKDASTQLEVVPAEFADRDMTVEVHAAYTSWEVNKDSRCFNTKDQPARDIFCLVTHPAVQKTVQTRCVVRPATVREVAIPAKYETIRREKLVCPATVRRVTIPAEYADVERTTKVCDGRMAWKLVDCDTPGSEPVTTEANNAPAPVKVTMKQSSRR